jgi:hypothetical protein
VGPGHAQHGGLARTPRAVQQHQEGRLLAGTPAQPLRDCPGQRVPAQHVPAGRRVRLPLDIVVGRRDAGIVGRPVPTGAGPIDSGRDRSVIHDATGAPCRQLSPDLPLSGGAVQVPLEVQLAP